jgi:hypothetical protein
LFFYIHLVLFLSFIFGCKSFAQVPAEVGKWVSNVANGNPQYIEICAKAIDAAVPPILNKSTKPCGFAPNGSELLSRLEKPPKIVAAIKQNLGALGPQDRLVVQIMSLFKLEEENGMPVPTLAVLKRAYESVAVITAKKMREVLDRLGLYGLIGEYDLRNPPLEHMMGGRSRSEGDAEATVYYALNYHLLQVRHFKAQTIFYFNLKTLLTCT